MQGEHPVPVAAVGTQPLVPVPVPAIPIQARSIDLPVPAVVRSTDRTRWLVIASLIAAGLVVLGFAGPWASRMLDLTVYRLGAQALLTGQDVYAVHEPATGLVFTYPLFAAVLFVPYAVMPNLLARLADTSLSLVALWILVHLTVRYVLLAGRSGRVGGAAMLRWSAPLTIVAVSVHPVLETILFGQINLIAAAFVILDVLVVRGARTQGWLVGLATGIKLVSGLFVVYFLVTRRWRAALNAALSFLATVAVGFVLRPAQAWGFWTDYGLDPDRVGGIAYVTNQSILGLTARLLRNPHPSAALTLGLSGTAAVVALILARRWHRRGDELTAVCLVAAGSLLASPISWSHHWVWVIPAIGILVAWADRWGTGWRWSIVVGVTLVLWLGPLQFTPKGGLQELHDNVGQEILANCFGALAIAFLVWSALRRPLAGSPGRALRVDGCRLEWFSRRLRSGQTRR